MLVTATSCKKAGGSPNAKSSPPGDEGSGTSAGRHKFLSTSKETRETRRTRRTRRFQLLSYFRYPALVGVS
ncbi:MAG: hypothetical protein F6K41_30535 [Symploca sp. SIO3E6]|nr:hypothetical protein [Caldora sp. SIO3E6]